MPDATIDELIWLSSLTDEALADAVLDEQGHEGKTVKLPAAVLDRARSEGRRRDWILREHVSRSIAHWAATMKHLALEHERLLRGTTL